MSTSSKTTTPTFIESLDRTVAFFDKGFKNEEEKIALIDILLNSNPNDRELIAARKIIMGRLAERELLGED